MKILVAVTTTDYKNLSDTTLRWLGRMSFDLRVFAPRNKRSKFLEAVADTNYQWYLDLSPKQTIVTRTTAYEYADQHGYDLIVRVPDTTISWTKRSRFKDEEVTRAYTAISNARGMFSRKPKKRIHKFANGIVMERVNKS